ncbi:hypothetical protein D9M70_571410 [compost metagenome]
MEFHDLVEAHDWPSRRHCLAAAVGIDDRLSCEQRPKLLHVAATRSREESAGDFEALFPGHDKAATSAADIDAGAAGKLTAGRRFAAERLADFIEADAEDIVQ